MAERSLKAFNCVFSVSFSVSSAFKRTFALSNFNCISPISALNLRVCRFIRSHSSFFNANSSEIDDTRSIISLSSFKRSSTNFEDTS